MDDQLILVDENDRPTGSAGKVEVHKKGLLHRAFSIFIFNSKGELLLQKRAKEKYHSGGLWTNTCCGHPVTGESITDAANRRLFEEMKMKVDISEVCTFQYRAEFENGLIENEIDHVFCGISDQFPIPNPLEVEEWKYIVTETLIKDVNLNEQNYTPWLKICIDKNILGELINLK